VTTGWYLFLVLYIDTELFFLLQSLYIQFRLLLMVLKQKKSVLFCDARSVVFLYWEPLGHEASKNEEKKNGEI
jgi:hypothetical protein